MISDIFYLVAIVGIVIICAVMLLFSYYIILVLKKIDHVLSVFENMVHEMQIAKYSASKNILKLVLRILGNRRR